MGHHEHRASAPRSIGCAVITISDSRTEQNDESGGIIKNALGTQGHRVIRYALIKNEPSEIRRQLETCAASSEIQSIITSGGTGISRRDLTIETISPLLSKRLDGFGELFRQLSFEQIGTASIMSRALGGVVNGKVILCLPGSAKAVELAMAQIIMPELGHLVWEATR